MQHIVHTGMKDIERQVCSDILIRQQLGIRKYGTTLAENDQTLIDRLQHAYEECLDQAVYLKWAIEKLRADERP